MKHEVTDLDINFIAVHRFNVNESTLGMCAANANANGIMVLETHVLKEYVYFYCR